MATIPVPRSYSEILGDMIDAFLSRYGLRRLKVGSPVLSILESVAQSQLRSSEDVFTLLEAQSLDNAEGVALDRIGADESTPRITQTSSTGAVTITDTSFTKISTRIYQGSAAPIAGSTAINVVDASSWNATGSIYLGRGTSDYEGPIAYTSKVNNSTYWTINLATPTLRFHNTGESVVVAQGGDRTVSAGTVVQTSQGNTSNAIQFKTLFAATIPDGETTITGVLVVATQAGLIGNIAASAINSFSSLPFNGATVTNPLPFTNGTSVEDDDTYRERIRQARQTRTKGTELAVQTNAVGVIANDENKRVLSASVVRRQGLPVTLFIDDGTGYEMVAAGAAIETLMDSALGGEQYFKVANRPIAKACVTSTITAPFTLAAGYKLKFAVNGVATEHTFSDDGTFNNIANATAYEVVASINANSLLNWQARTANSGTNVVVTAKADTNESIQCQTVTDGTDANAYLGFSTTRVDSLRLYKNDLLLNKDGKPAIIQSSTIDQWSTLTSPQTLTLTVDGIQLKFDGTMFNAFTDADFIAANTGFTTLGKNSLAAWAAVFNYRIPGITATVSSGTIVLSSNRGNSSTASLAIASTGGTLVTNHMFTATTSTGANNDYTLNRNTGEIGLAAALVAADKLTAGSKYTRAFLQTPSISTITTGATANLWFALDSGATVVSSGVTNSTTLTFTATATAYGFRIHCAASTAAFTSQQPGDWVTFWDSQLAPMSGSYRINYVDPSGFFFEFDKATTFTATTSLVAGGMQFWRLTNIIPPQHITVASGSNYTATSIAAAIALSGGSTATYRTNYVRANTNTYSDVNGDIALVAGDVNGQKLGFSIGSAKKNLTGHTASVESADSELGTPHFKLARIQAVTSQTAITIDRLPNTIPAVYSTMAVLRANDTATATSGARYSSQYGFRTTLKDAAQNTTHWNLDLNSSPEQTWLLQDRLAFVNPFMLAPDDSMTVVVDGDTTQKRFSVPMYRTVKPTTNTYSASNSFTDTDNGGAVLANSFGTGFKFTDFAAFMAARGITNSADATRTVLWRYYRLGPDGNNVRVQFQNPKTPNATVGFSIDSTTNATVDVGLTLASGAQRSTTNIRNTTYLGYMIGTPASGMSTVTYVTGFSVVSGTRVANTATLNLSVPGGCTDHGLHIGKVIYVNSTDPNYPSGAYSVTGFSGSPNFQVIYSDASVSTAALSGTVTVSLDSAGEATLLGSGTQVGDYFYTSVGNPFSSTAPSMRLTAVNNQNWSGLVPYSGAAVTAVTWNATPLNDATKFLMFANANMTAASLVTAYGALTNKIVSPTLIGAGTGVIDRSSDEDASASPTWLTLVDGVNYIQSSAYAGDYTFVFKNGVSSTLTGANAADWQNETIKLVPLTAKNVTDWLNTLGVTGLSSVAEITSSSNATKVQIASLTAGSAGSVQVQGGSANAATASASGAATTSTNGGTLITQVPAANVTGMYAGQYVYIDNVATQPKSGIFDQNTNLTSFNANGTLTFNAGGTPIITKRSSSTNAVLKFEKHGPFVAISDTGLGTALTLGSVVEGDWISLVLPAAPTGGRTQIAAGNAGLYRVVRVVTPGFDATAGTVWIENTGYSEQNNAECDVVFLAPNSVLPGDVINIATTLWGTANMGKWTVTSVGGTPAYNNAFTCVVDVSTKTPVDPGAVGALGTTNANLVQCIEAKPAHLVKKVLSVSQSAASPTTLVDVKFDSTNASSSINPAAGSVITALDKLNFPTSLKQGIDGYQYSTGLIQAVNKVEYGDPADPATYPGIVAAGALVNIEGAPIKRIQVSVALRVRSGSLTDIANSAKSAIAAVINSTPVGQPIALVDIVEAAKVPGVISTVMISPLMTSGTDLINVQPYEKPLVLNLDQDIQVSFIGD